MAVRKPESQETLVFTVCGSFAVSKSSFSLSLSLSLSLLHNSVGTALHCVFAEPVCWTPHTRLTHTQQYTVILLDLCDSVEMKLQVPCLV